VSEEEFGIEVRCCGEAAGQSCCDGGDWTSVSEAAMIEVRGESYSRPGAMLELQAVCREQRRMRNP